MVNDCQRNLMSLKQQKDSGAHHADYHDYDEDHGEDFGDLGALFSGHSLLSID